jgi:hypothetical protein
MRGQSCLPDRAPRTLARFIIVFFFRHRILVVQSHVEQGIVVGRFIVVVVVVVVVGIATTCPYGPLLPDGPAPPAG